MSIERSVADASFQRTASSGKGSKRVASVSANKQHIKEHRAYKLIVVGSSNVGKTCLTCLFADGVCPDSTEATIGVDFREKKVVVEKEIIKVRDVFVYLPLLDWFDYSSKMLQS